MRNEHTGSPPGSRGAGYPPDLSTWKHVRADERHRQRQPGQRERVRILPDHVRALRRLSDGAVRVHMGQDGHAGALHEALVAGWIATPDEAEGGMALPSGAEFIESTAFQPLLLRRT